MLAPHGTTVPGSECCPSLAPPLGLHQDSALLSCSLGPGGQIGWLHPLEQSSEGICPASLVADWLVSLCRAWTPRTCPMGL